MTAFKNAFLIVVVAAISPSLRADEPESAVDTFSQEAAEYEFTVRDKPLTMRPTPLLNWGNPARSGENGSVFLWTDEDRPCVIGTCFTYVYDNNIRNKHALLLLGDSPVIGRHGNRVLWTPRTDGLNYRSLSTAPGPTAVQRNTQLRQIARQFSVTLTLKDERTEQCRLVPQPLVRYDSDDEAKACGAIFSFAVGTDPEAFLIIDRRPDAAGKLAWHYAFARFTFYPLEAYQNQQSVWKADKLENMLSSIFTRPDYQREPYITFRSEWLDR